MTLKLGIIGAGRIGKVHAESVSRIAEANVVSIADVYVEAAQETAARLNIPHATADYTEIINDASIDAVLICSSTDTHSQIIEEAARAGKHIFCEKPIDADLKRIDHALAVVEETGVKLQIGFNRRFDPNFARVRQAVLEGQIGIPHLLHIISRDPGPPPIAYIKVSGGIFFDMMIHDFDMARFLIGSEVTEIYAAGGAMVDPAIGEAGDIDTAMVTLKFENGVIGTIDNSRKAVYGYDQRVEVFGSGGAINTHNNYPNQAVLSTANSIHRDLPLHFFLERYMDSYIKEIRDFVDAVVNDTETPVSGHDGRVPVVMALAAKKSLAENRPVKLSEIDG